MNISTYEIRLPDEILSAAFTEEEIQLAENFLKMSGASKIVRTSSYNHEGIQELMDLIETIDLTDY